MSRTYKILSTFALLALLTLTFATPVRAFDGRSGENVTIKADEVVEDDLYVSASTFVLDGTVKGDLLVVGETITINGTVEGDLMAAGKTIIINGTVTDDIRIAGAALQVGENASIGGDLIAAGASLETKKGNVTSGDLVVGSGQALLAGDVAGNVLAGTGSLELRGAFGGDVEAAVGDAEDHAGGPPPPMFMSDMGVSVPVVASGLTITEGTTIKGNLKYTFTNEIKVPTGSVSGKVTHIHPVVTPETAPLTPAQKAMSWTLGLLRNIATLIILGLLLCWLMPMFIGSLADKVRSQPWPTLGWGVVTYAAFFFALLVILLVMILGAILFGVLTLGGLSGTIIGVGIFTIFTLILGFVLVTSFLTKIVVGWLGGKLILSRIKPELAEHKIWPMVIGVSIIALIVSLPYIGWLLGLLVTFVGLGALWLWGRERVNKQTVIA
ncbi:MAG: polymer-forming cytoskeletal protein [Anaerolineales bacterium]|nr:polymer-forming cytoskeletal protein [Anaerolineales bacterium]